MQRQHRLRVKLDANFDAPKSFRPRILRFDRCGMCGEWHPTQVVLPNGTFHYFTLDAYHDQVGVNAWKRDLKVQIDALKPKPEEPTSDPLARCITNRMTEENETEEVAKEKCEMILKDPMVLELLMKQDAEREGLPSPQEQCAGIRVQVYQETWEEAMEKCYVIVNGPFAKSYPGIIPVEVDAEPWNTKDPLHIAYNECFKKKVANGLVTSKADVLLALKECAVEIRQQLEGDISPISVPPLFGKTPKEIAATYRTLMQDPNLTVPPLYGKTRTQIDAEAKELEEGTPWEQCLATKKLEGYNEVDAKQKCREEGVKEDEPTS